MEAGQTGRRMGVVKFVTKNGGLREIRRESWFKGEKKRSKEVFTSKS